MTVRSSSPEFADWIAEARAVPLMDVLGRRGVRLKRSGVEWVGPCPVCGGRDRFGVNERKGVFVCRGSGNGGGAIDLVRYLDGCDWRVACEILTGRKPPGRAQGETAEARAEREAALAKRAAVRARLDAKRARDQQRFRERERRRCWEMWEEAVALPGSPAEDYLRLRGLELPSGKALRCHLNLPLYADGGPDAPVVHRGPALVGAIIGPSGRFSGLHATWIDLSATSGKVMVADPETGELVPAKKIRGSADGGHIPLVACKAPEVLVLGEGTETVLSVWRALAATGWPDLSRAAFWSGLSRGNLGGPARESVRHPTLKVRDIRGHYRVVKVQGPRPDLTRPGLPIPPSVRRIHLLGDSDSDRFTTLQALTRAARRFKAADPSIDVRVSWAPDGEDFNDVLRRAAA